MKRRPLIGITPDLEMLASGRLAAVCAVAYLDGVRAAGGEPVVLAPIPEGAGQDAASFEGFVLTGGGDPSMEAFGRVTHPKATLVHPRRQAYEMALLRALEESHPHRPVLGVCLGMQMMSLHAGGDLDQHLPDTLATHAVHKNGAHPVRSCDAGAARWLPGLEGGDVVHSNHRQAVSDPGRLIALAKSGDGVIEAVGDPARAFYLGVQWHPERTESLRLGLGVFEAMVRAAGG